MTGKPRLRKIQRYLKKSAGAGRYLPIPLAFTTWKGSGVCRTVYIFMDNRKKRILIVEDDKNIADIVDYNICKQGYETDTAYDGEKGLALALSGQYDLILLDVMLPKMDGFQVCREIRRVSNIPIIMLTAKGETFDKVLGLELGADDYMVKPFENKELVARIKAILRRYDPKDNSDKEVVYPNIIINLTNYELKINGASVDIPPKELELLYFLATNPNKVFTREQLLETVWGFDYFGDSRTVDVHVKRLREKLEKAGENVNWQLKTVWGVGYKFEVK